MANLNPADYPPPLAELLRQLPLMPLGPGEPHRGLRHRLEAIPSAFPAGAGPDMVAACHAGLWLAFDFLDESHTISQGIDTPTGSYWHGLMHRREPDFANSAYWSRRVGQHPVFAELCEQAAWLAAGEPQQRRLASLVTQGKWDPFAFIDLCRESYDEKAPAHLLCRQVQLAEWRLLFDWCYRRAVGG
jgi:hypothetical protein